MSTRCVCLRIHGRVQGVFYRANARATGARLGLRGWVRNCDDGTVEALACGDQAAVEHYIEWCHRGSPAANVLRVEVRAVIADGQLGASFDVRH